MVVLFCFFFLRNFCGFGSGFGSFFYWVLVVGMVVGTVIMVVAGFFLLMLWLGLLGEGDSWARFAW